MKIKGLIISALTAILILMLPILESCRTEICYDHFPMADISLDWEQEWERDYGMGHAAAWNNDFYGFDYNDLRPETPEWVNMVRYTDNGDVESEKYLPPQGTQMMLDPKKDKSFLFYNGDTEYIVLSDMATLADARATATTRTRASISYIIERHPGARSMNPPDILYSSYVDQAPDIGVHETKPFPVKLQPLVFTYVVRYEFEKGSEHVALARGALAGMAESVYLRDGKTSDQSAILLYDCEVKDYGCEAHVRSFGIPGFPDRYYGRAEDGSEDSPYTLNLEVMLKNGDIKEFNFDIADQLKKQPKGGVIKVTGIKIEDEEAEPKPVSSGFEVDITTWGSGIDVDMPLTTDEEL